MIFRQITHDDLGCASYLIGDDDARVAAVVDPRLDIATASLVVVTAGAIAGGLGHVRAGRVCWRHAGSFTAAAVVGTLAGQVVSGSLVVVAFALVMLIAAHATWRKAEREDDGTAATWEGGGVCPPLRLPRDIVAGLAVGFLTGFLGVGGGFLIVPTLVIALAFTMRTAVGTSLAIITGTSLVGLVAHLASGRSPDVGVTAAMSGACVAEGLAHRASHHPRRLRPARPTKPQLHPPTDRMTPPGHARGSIPA